MSTWEAAASAVHVEIQTPDEEGMYEDSSPEILRLNQPWGSEFGRLGSGATTVEGAPLKKAGEVDPVDAGKRS
jgi:hypothetical protein